MLQYRKYVNYPLWQASVISNKEFVKLTENAEHNMNQKQNVNEKTIMEQAQHEKFSSVSLKNNEIEKINADGKLQNIKIFHINSN